LRAEAVIFTNIAPLFSVSLVVLWAVGSGRLYIVGYSKSLGGAAGLDATEAIVQELASAL
jgi:hypothetical protein